MITDFAAFLGISMLVIATPGQDTALTLRNTLVGGRRSGIFTAIGVATGQATWTLAASAGLTALLLASEPIFVALKLAGAAYLIFLGSQALWTALHPDPALSHQPSAVSPFPVSPSSRLPVSSPSVSPSLRPSVSFRQGVVSDLGNPKMAVFFTSLLPQFTTDGHGSFFALLTLGLVFCLLTLAWLTGYALAVARASHLLRLPRIRRTLDALLGTVLVALGLRLATAHR
jgi:threonine/homoserine/homoserine lactone efflux protein